MVTLLRHPCLSPFQTWWKMTPNVIMWAPEISVYLFQIFQLMRKQILTPYPQRLCSQALWHCSWNGHSLICSFCLQGSMGPTLSLSRFLVSGNRITHMDAEASLLLTPLLCSPCHPLQPSFPPSSQPSLSAGLPPALSSFCVAPGKKLPLMDSIDPDLTLKSPQLNQTRPPPDSAMPL